MILEHISENGIENTINTIDGMFSIAVWDKKEECIYLARDRVGIKPLYWTKNSDFLFFCSDLRCLNSLPNFNPSIKKESLSELLKYGYIRSPNSIFKNVYKLNPGEILSINKLGYEEKNVYWSTDSLKDIDKFSKKNNQSIQSEIKKELFISIKKSMVSDVSIGAFLSGGIDSSLLVSMMSQLTKKLETFSIGFNEKKFNEAHYAKKIADYLKTDHHEMYVSNNDLLDVIPQLPEIYSEPFGDSSQIPTYLVSKMSKKHVKVVLSGDGADELFGGYNRYFYADKIRKIKKFFPNFFKKNVSKFFISLLEHKDLKLLEKFNFYKIPQLKEKLKKIFLILNQDDKFIYEALISTNLNPNRLINSYNSSNPHNGILKFTDSNFFEYMQKEDFKNYLPDDILTKVDRASMFCSQEVRVPYLNKDVIELSWKLDPGLKKKKIILKRILKEFLPEKFFLRPKMGFGIPLGEWLNGKLYDWMNDTLSKKKVVDEGFFNYNEIENLMKDNISITNNKYLLWNVITFQAWFDNFKKNKIIKL